MPSRSRTSSAGSQGPAGHRERRRLRRVRHHDACPRRTGQREHRPVEPRLRTGADATRPRHALGEGRGGHATRWSAGPGPARRRGMPRHRCPPATRCPPRSAGFSTAASPSSTGPWSSTRPLSLPTSASAPTSRSRHRSSGSGRPSKPRSPLTSVRPPCAASWSRTSRACAGSRSTCRYPAVGGPLTEAAHGRRDLALVDGDPRRMPAGHRLDLELDRKEKAAQGGAGDGDVVDGGRGSADWEAAYRQRFPDAVPVSATPK